LSDAESAKVLRLIIGKDPRQLQLSFFLWSVGAAMALVKKLFNKIIAESTMRGYLKKWGLTTQRPATRYTSRDDVIVQHWLDSRYPEIAAKAKAEGAEIHWLDEAGINNQAIYQTGYALKGRTPVARKPSRREKISMISSVSNQGTMRFKLYEGSLNTAIFLTFLENLIAGAKQKVFVIMGFLPLHKSQAVKDWLAANANKIEAFYLPPYAPDLNPDEYLNNDLKQNVHRYSGLSLDLRTLKSRARAYLRHIQKSPAKVASYFKACLSVLLPIG
jgi:transposase